MNQSNQQLEAFKAFKEDLAEEYQILNLEAKSQKETVYLVSTTEIINCSEEAEKDYSNLIM